MSFHEEKQITLCSNCNHDWLTGLYSRAFLDLYLVEAIPRAVKHEGALWVMMIDVDDFKNYNTLFGHRGGDEALRKIARVLTQSNRAGEIVARYAGDEFTVVFSRADESQALRFAERLRKEVNTLAVQGRAISITIGLAKCPRDGDTPTKIMLAADEALGKAKQKGKNRVCLL